MEWSSWGAIYLPFLVISLWYLPVDDDAPFFRDDWLAIDSLFFSPMPPWCDSIPIFEMKSRPNLASYVDDAGDLFVKRAYGSVAFMSSWNTVDFFFFFFSRYISRSHSSPNRNVLQLCFAAVVVSVEGL